MVADVTILKGDTREVLRLVARQPTWEWTILPIRGGTLAVGCSDNKMIHELEGPTPGSVGLSIEVLAESIVVTRGPFAWIPVWWSGGRLTWISSAPATLGDLVARIPCRFREHSWQTSPRLDHGISDFAQGVSRLPPSTKVIIDASGLLFSPVQEKPLFQFEPDQFEMAATTFRDIFMSCLEKMPTDAGIALSGGLDSSAILAGLVALGRRPRTFTMKTRHRISDETKWVEGLTHHFGLPSVTTFDIDGYSPFVRDIPFVEGPQSQPTEPFETAFYRYAAAKQSVLTGLGADQLFDASLRRRLRSAWKFNDHVSWSSEESIHPPHRLIRNMLAHGPDPTERIFESWAWEMALRGMRRTSRELAHPVYAPFLCQPLLDCARMMPSHWYQQGASNKHILRHVLRDMLPKAVCERAKETHFGPVVTESVHRSLNPRGRLESLDPSPSVVVPSLWRGFALTRWKMT